MARANFCKYFDVFKKIRNNFTVIRYVALIFVYLFLC